MPGTLSSKGGVIAYTVMQAYGSLALEDNLEVGEAVLDRCCLLYTSPSPRDRQKSRMPSSA